MKPTLDHIGIAVREVAEALAFYQETLGLDAGPPEVVDTERVRVRTLGLGGPTIELLEAMDADSAVGRFVARRGPGLHHITFRVQDIRGAMGRLKARGVRLVTEQPRPGADGSLVVFIHPNSAHGVLVELTEKPSVSLVLNVQSMSLGDLRLTTVHDGGFRLDGGAMFGVVPRTLWEKATPPDERHRIQLAMRPLLVEGSWGRLLVDCGAGDKMGPKQTDIYALDRTRHLDDALATAGTGADAIDLVLATHLHFDHFGGATAFVDGAVRPRFPNARYLIRAAEWEDATHPHARNRASYLPDDFVPLREAGVVDFLPGDGTVVPGVRVERTGGHTGQHQIVYLESAGQTAVFVADMIPTTAHLQDPWVMGYDLFPLETLAFKQRFIREAIDREYVIFFEHDPLVAAGYVRERDGKRYVEPVL